MRSLRLLLPAVNIALFAVVAVAFIMAHGGLHGDAGLSGAGTDTVSTPSDKGLVVFNRWEFAGHQESLLTQAFLAVNVGAFLGARIILAALGAATKEFRTPYPFGLSYASYTLLLGLALSVLQWFGIGLGLEIIRRRVGSLRPVR